MRTIRQWLADRRDAETAYFEAVGHAHNSLHIGDYRSAANHLADAACHHRAAWPWNPVQAHRIGVEALLTAAIGDARVSGRLGLTRFSVPVLLSPGFLSTLDSIDTPRMRRTARRIEDAAGGALDDLVDANTEAAHRLITDDLYSALIGVVGGQAAEALARFPRIEQAEQLAERG